MSTIHDKDMVLEDLIREIDAISPSNESSMKNMASYVTSKFTRFVSDRACGTLVAKTRLLTWMISSINGKCCFSTSEGGDSAIKQQGCWLARLFRAFGVWL